MQYSKSKKNFIITAFSIFNNAKLEKFSATKRAAFEGQPQDFSFFEQKSENNKGFLGTTQIKIKNSFSDNSFLYYNLGYNPTKDNFSQNTNRYSENNNFYEIDDLIKNTTFSNFLSWNKDLNNSKLVLAFSQINQKYSDDLNIYSDQNLFQTNSSLLFQNYTIQSNRYAFDFYVKNKNKFINFNFRSGFSYKSEDSKLIEWISQSTERRALKIYHYINDLNLHKQIGKFDVSAALSSHFLNVNDDEEHYLEKRINIRFSHSSNDFELEYNSRYELPTLKMLQNNLFYTKDLSYFQNAGITPSFLSNIKTYKFTWHRFNFEKGNSLFLMLMYDKTKPNFTTNTINYGTFTGIENTTGIYNDRLLFLLTGDRRFNKNFILKTKLTSAIVKNINFINGNENTSTIKNFEISQKISTNFKNKPIQFDLGYTYTKGLFDQSFYSTSAKQDNVKLSLGIRTIIKKQWIANVLGEYLIQKTDQNTLKNFLISGQVSYRKEKSNFEYNLLFNNILNLNSFQYINSFTSQLGIDEISTTALRGYIIGGLKYNF